MDPTPKKVQRRMHLHEASVSWRSRPRCRPGSGQAHRPFSLPAFLRGASSAIAVVMAAFIAPGMAPSARAADAPPAGAIVPPEGEGVTLVGEPMVYYGDELYDYINGGAPHFIEYGFEEVASQELQFAEHTYIFDVYRLADPLGAFGLFTTRAPEGAPMIGVFPNSSLTAFQGLVAHGPYFFDISAYETGPWVGEEIATLLSRATAGMPPALVGENPHRGFPLGYLPVTGRQIGTEKLARGPVSLRAALGSAARGSFWTLIEQVQHAVGESAREGSARDDRPAADGRTPAAWWVVGGYHPLLDDMNDLTPQTTLAMLVDAGDLSRATKLAEGIAETFPDVRTVGGGRLWTEDGRTGYVLGTADRLFFITSSLDFKTIEGWAARLLEP